MSTVVKIENAYSDGHLSEHEVKLDTPTGDVEEWFDEVVYEHTGDGHGIDNDLGYCHTATVIASDDPGLLGQTYEWAGS